MTQGDWHFRYAFDTGAVNAGMVWIDGNRLFHTDMPNVIGVAATAGHTLRMTSWGHRRIATGRRSSARIRNGYWTVTQERIPLFLELYKN